LIEPVLAETVDRAGQVLSIANRQFARSFIAPAAVTRPLQLRYDSHEEDLPPLVSQKKAPIHEQVRTA
jgi:hypothetical protein